MARRLFFVPEVRRGTAELSGADAEHLTRVLRVEAGEVYEISDNTRGFLARVQTARKALVVFEVLEELPPVRETARVCLFPALFKFDRFEWMVEKATELGATEIRAFSSTRSERGLDRAAEKRVTRWQKIAQEASQQSRRRQVPEVSLEGDLDGAVQRKFDYQLMFDEAESAMPLLGVCEGDGREVTDTIGILIGPEGGWTDAEREQITGAGWKACSLGSTILRAETAAIAALSAINVLWKR
jgi:16S rRNA (uracil1498-N3)-methyltransferase